MLKAIEEARLRNKPDDVVADDVAGLLQKHMQVRARAATHPAAAGWHAGGAQEQEQQLSGSAPADAPGPAPPRAARATRPAARSAAPRRRRGAKT